MNKNVTVRVRLMLGNITVVCVVPFRIPLLKATDILYVKAVILGFIPNHWTLFRKQESEQQKAKRDPTSVVFVKQASKYLTPFTRTFLW